MVPDNWRYEMSKKDQLEKNILSFWQKTAFGTGGAVNNLTQNAVNAMANQVLNICLGVNPLLVGLVVFSGRIWDAFTDPLMGSISDNTHGRFGRRRPYMLVGGLLAALMFVVIWRMPYGESEIANFLMFLVTSLAFYTCATVFCVPYQALGYEVTPNYNERTRVMAYQAFFGASAGLAIQWQHRISKMDCFENNLDGMRTVSLWVAGIMVIGVLVSTFFSKERLAHTVSRQKKIPLIASLKVTMLNRDFRKLIISLMMICLGLFMINQLGLYVNIFHVFGGDRKAASTVMGIAGTLYHLSGGILAAPLISFVASRIGKKKTLQWGLTFAIVGAASKFFTYDPRWPYLQLLSFLIMSPGLTCLWVLMPSLCADICDEDELATGVRREGMYSAVYTNVLKIGVSLGLLGTGIILTVSGFDIDLGIDQVGNTMMIMRVCYSVIPVVGLIIGFLLITRLKSSPERAKAVRVELDARHAETDAEIDAPKEDASP